MGKPGHVRTRCLECPACLNEDCGECKHCLRKTRFGGDGSSKEACVMRRCYAIYGPEGKRKKKNTNKEKISIKTKETTNPTPTTNLKSPNSSTVSPKNRSSAGAERERHANRGGEQRAPFDANVEEDSAVNFKNNISESGSTNSHDDVEDHGWRCQPPSMLDDDELFPRTSELLYGREKLPKAPQILFSTHGSDPTIKQHNHYNPRPAESKKKPSHLYGLPIPTIPNGICARCLELGDPDEVSLLCDGPNCGREYHLRCCIPPIDSVPEGAFLCVDCNPKGSTASLEQYLDEHDDRKASLMEDLVGDDNSELGSSWQENAFIDTLLLDDIRQKDEEESQEGRVGSGDVTKRTPSPSKSKSGTTPSPSTKAGNTRNEQRVPLSELWLLHQSEDRVSLFVGRALRLYCPLGNSYHNGRILDARRPTTWGKHVRASSGNHKASDSLHVTDTECLVRFPAGIDHRKVPLVRWIRLEEHCVAVATRIVWGKFANDPLVHVDGNTKGAAVGSSVRKGRKRKSNWLPARLWSRTARELVPVTHLLSEPDGQIRFRLPIDSCASSKERSKSPDNRHGKRRSVNHTFPDERLKQPPAWGLAEMFGGKTYRLLHVELEVRDDIPSSMRAILMGGDFVDGRAAGDHELRTEHQRQLLLRFSMARAELAEQERVQKWNSLPLDNPVHPLALTCRDEDGLGSLDYRTSDTLPHSSNNRTGNVNGGEENSAKSGGPFGCGNKVTDKDIELSPLIGTGLDRAYILESVSRQFGVEPSKDLASSLVCELVESVATAAQVITTKQRDSIPSISTGQTDSADLDRQ